MMMELLQQNHSKRFHQSRGVHVICSSKKNGSKEFYGAE
jgi:hypothetical protein